MKIIIEIGWGHKKGGARRVTINTLLEMLTLRPDNEYFVLSNSIHEGLINTPIRQIQLKSPYCIPQTIWDQFLFPHLAVPLACKDIKPDVIHFTNHLASFFEICPAVVTIHDMIPFIMPEAFRKDHLVYLKLYYKHAVKVARKIITVSENSKNDICEILKVKRSKVIVSHLAADFHLPIVPEKQTQILSNNNIKQPFFLYVGSIHPRKNLGRIIEAFAILKREKDIPHILVIAGSIRWKSNDLFKTKAFQEVASHIVFLGVVDDVELGYLYSACTALVWPSLYEGFGLPVLEAMSFGSPVITSNCSSLPEVAGDAALLVDPYSIREICDAMWNIIDVPNLALSLKKNGYARCQQFSWRKTAETVLSVLEMVAGE